MRSATLLLLLSACAQPYALDRDCREPAEEGKWQSEWPFADEALEHPVGIRYGVFPSRAPSRDVRDVGVLARTVAELILGEQPDEVTVTPEEEHFRIAVGELAGSYEPTQARFQLGRFESSPGEDRGPAESARRFRCAVEHLRGRGVLSGAYPTDRPLLRESRWALVRHPHNGEPEVESGVDAYEFTTYRSLWGLPVTGGSGVSLRFSPEGVLDRVELGLPEIGAEGREERPTPPGRLVERAWTTDEIRAKHLSDAQPQDPEAPVQVWFEDVRYALRAGLLVPVHAITFYWQDRLTRGGLTWEYRLDDRDASHVELR